MDRDEFEVLIVEALSTLPAEFQDQLDNVDVLVEQFPTREQLAEAGLTDSSDLLGLYEGVPHVERTQGYDMVLPDRITLFQNAIEAKCRSDEEVAEEIKKVLCHEIAHHFGIDEDVLDRIEENRN